MKAVVFLGDRKAAVQERKDLEPRVGEVVVEMKASGICGSDMHKYRATAEEVKKQGFSNLVIGHEPAGIVAKVGEGVENVKIGERVWVYHNAGCGYCTECLSGYHQLCKKLWLLGTNCDGSWSDFMLTRAVSCMKLPEKLSFVDGAIMACTGGTVLHAIERLRVTALDTVAIYGMGPLGLCGVLFAKSMGARVLAIDLEEERLNLAKKMGASAVINARRGDPVEAIRLLTEQKGATASMDFSGNAAENSIRSLRFGGRAVLIGFGRDMIDGFHLKTHDMIFRNLSVLGNLVFPIDACQRMMNFLALHQISLESMVTHKFRLEQATEALKLFDSLKTGKVCFIW